MADDPAVNVKKKVELEAMERAYVVRGLDVLYAQLKRGRTLQVDGSELHRYSTNEMARVVAIKEKFQ